MFRSHPSPCTVLIIMVSTFSSLTRSLCLSSALLLETCGAASHLSPTLVLVVVERDVWAVAKTDQLQDLCHSVCVLSSFICLCSHSPTSSICFEMDKTSCYGAGGHMVQSGCLFWQVPAVWARGEFHAHLHCEIPCTGCRVIWSQQKIGSGLECII